jgi:hypothetical protein
VARNGSQKRDQRTQQSYSPQGNVNHAGWFHWGIRS